MTKKILITGATGFVGTNLRSYLLASGYTNLVSISRTRLNLLNDADLSDVYAIIHLAGKAHDIKNTSDAEEYYQINYGLTKKLYDLFQKSNCKKFIFISTVKAVTDTVNTSLTESFTPDPKTPYGKSKLMAEAYIQSLQLDQEKSYYILRPCMIHGPGNKGNLNLLYKFVTTGVPYPLAAFNNKRSFLSIDNLCFVLKEILEKSIRTGIYHVADDEPLSTNEVVKILAKANQTPVRLWKVPVTLIRYLAKVGSVCKLPFNSDNLNKLTENYIVQNQKIKDALNVKLPLTCREGIAKTAKSFKKTN